MDNVELCDHDRATLFVVGIPVALVHEDRPRAIAMLAQYIESVWGGGHSSDPAFPRAHSMKLMRKLVAESVEVE